MVRLVRHQQLNKQRNPFRINLIDLLATSLLLSPDLKTNDSAPICKLCKMNRNIKSGSKAACTTIYVPEITLFVPHFVLKGLSSISWGLCAGRPMTKLCTWIVTKIVLLDDRFLSRSRLGREKSTLLSRSCFFLIFIFSRSTYIAHALISKQPGLLY
jgi:hypothetical protein